MPKTIYFAAATLDGYIADDHDRIDWLTGFESGYAGPGEPVMEAIDAFIDGIGALVMGSATYEFILGHDWVYGERPSWVLTSRELPVAAGADVRFHDGPVAEVHAEMLQAAGDRDMWCIGGGPVASQLVAARLLDELWVTVVPIALGSGKPLFSEPVADPMRLLGSRPFANGMYELRYSLQV